ncbi:hypothetical protein NQ318_015833, partial [Aromia moschata]
MENNESYKLKKCKYFVNKAFKGTEGLALNAFELYLSKHENFVYIGLKSYNNQTNFGIINFDFLSRYIFFNENVSKARVIITIPNIHENEKNAFIKAFKITLQIYSLFANAFFFSYNNHTIVTRSFETRCINIYISFQILTKDVPVP